MNNKHYVGKKVSSFENYSDVGPITGVALIVDEENEYRAGDNSGFVLEVDCPYGTQTMADNILTSVRGYTYRGFRATDAELDMIAELGDGITVNGLYSMLAYRNLTFGPGHMSEIAAPGESELEHEYPYISSTQREIARKIAETRSSITKTAEEIRLEVENELEGLSASFTVKLNSITSRVEGVEGQVSSIEQYVDSITLSVSSADGSSTFKLTAGTTELSTQTLNLSVDAVNVTGTLKANQINLTGAITFDDLADDVYYDINDAYAMAEDAQDSISGMTYTYGGKTYIDENMLMTSRVRASILEGGEIVLLDGSENEAGYITLEGAASYNGRKIVIDSGAIELTAQYGDVYLISADGAHLHLESDVVLGGADTRPNEAGRYSCGTSTYTWSDVYADNDTIQTSDLTKKKDIIYGMSAYETFFDALKPMSFLFVDGSSGRRHMGLGAQDVLNVLTGAGLTTQDFAGFVAAPKRDETGQVIEGEYDYFLRYGEFIPLCIEQIQNLKKRVSALEGTA